MSEDEKVRERVKRSLYATEHLAKMIVAFDEGNVGEFIRLYDEALERRFEDGIQYARDSVGEWNGK